MKFIHFADCHLDGFRDYKLAELGFANFKAVINAALKEQVDFVLLAGDLFNTAIPRVEALKIATQQLKRLQDANIPVYAIAGSHDYSPNGKTVLDVLELAGLLDNVMKGEVTENKQLQLQFTKDEKTGALITGIIGKKGMLDSAYYKSLDTSKLVGKGFKIFMFHTAIEELKTKEFENMPGHSITMLPTGFNYYAGGHVHVVQRYSDKNYQNIVYPGPTFPNSFSELEQLEKGSYILFDDSTGQEPTYEHKFLEPKQVQSFKLDVDKKTAQEAHDFITQQTAQEEVIDKIILLRITGTLLEGSIKEILLDEIIRELHQQGAFLVLRNTAKLNSVSFSELALDENKSDVETVEEETISEHLGQIALPTDLDEQEVIKKLLQQLELQQLDGETKGNFTTRVIDTAKAELEEQ